MIIIVQVNQGTKNKPASSLLILYLFEEKSECVIKTDNKLHFISAYLPFCLCLFCTDYYYMDQVLDKNCTHFSAFTELTLLNGGSLRFKQKNTQEKLRRRYEKSGECYNFTIPTAHYRRKGE